MSKTFLNVAILSVAVVLPALLFIRVPPLFDELSFSQQQPFSSPDSRNFIALPLENETLLSHSMRASIQIDLSIKIVSTFVLVNNDSIPLSYFALYLNTTIYSVFCYDPLGSLDFQWLIIPKSGNLINVTLRQPLLPDNLYVFSVAYLLEGLIYHNEGILDYYGLDFEVSHPRNTLTFILDLSLPFYADLLNDGPFLPIIPSASKIYKENEIVTIQWFLEQRAINETDVFLVRFTFASQDESLFSLRPLYYSLTLLAGLLLGGATVFLIDYFRKKPVEKELVSSLLTNTEQEIIKAINADGGVSTQRRICEKTGFSKSKVSQILAKLEEKKVLRRERWGRTNKVTIINASMRQLGALDSSNNKKSEI